MRYTEDICLGAGAAPGQSIERCASQPSCCYVQRRWCGLLRWAGRAPVLLLVSEAAKVN